MNPLLRLKELGQSPWLDDLRRPLLEDGSFRRLMLEDGICGITSNPTILARAIAGAGDYRSVLERLRPRCADTAALYEALVREDIRLAADELAPVYRDSGRRDGYVSLEVSPDLAYDAPGSVREAERLWALIDRPNLMIKIPATEPGLEAIGELIARGINVNATLIFSPRRYVQVAEAWQAGLQRRLDRGQAVDGIASVASFFVSRIETLADRRLEEAAPARPRARSLLGKVAVAAAKCAWGEFRRLREGPFRERFEGTPVQIQRPLWASTSTKNPAYPDVKYVDALVGPDTVTTLPLETIAAYRDHGDPAPRLERGLEEAQEVLRALGQVGIDFEALAAQLEREGVDKFRASYQELLEALAQG